MAAVFLLNGQGTAGLVFGGLALLTAWVFSLWRQQIQLATQLLGVSAHGLAANSGIITTTVLLNLAALVAVLPLGAFLGGFRGSGGELRATGAHSKRHCCSRRHHLPSKCLHIATSLMPPLLQALL